MSDNSGRVFGLSMHWQILIAMVVGAGLGLLLGNTAGEFETTERVEYHRGNVQVYGMNSPAPVRGGTFWSRDERDRVLMEITERTGAAPPAPEAGAEQPKPPQNYRRIFVGILNTFDGESLEALPWPERPMADAGTNIPTATYSSLEEVRSKDPAAYALFQTHGRSWSRAVADGCRMLGNLFLRMLRMVSVPLVIVSLLSGVMGLGGAESFGKMFTRTMIYYLVTSTLAILVGLTMVNIIRPGKGPENALAQVLAPAEIEEKGKGVGAVLFEQVETMIPINPIEAASSGNFLSLISFTLAFGIAALMAGGAVAKTTKDVADAGFGAMMVLTLWVIRLAPIGVFGLMLFATASQGLGVFVSLGWYMITVVAALAFHAIIVLPLVVKFVGKRSPWEFAKAMSPALLMAFSSSSSNGTLPVTMASAEKRAGVKNRICSFVLPLGATVNMDGTALYEVIAVIFIANVTPGVELSLGQQVVIAYTALLVSIGAAGIPQAGLVMMIIILQAVGLPTEAQGIIIAVDRVLDMGRTVVNVWSDACGCAVINRFDGDPAGTPATAA